MSGHARRLAHALPHEIVERRAARPFRDQREHDEPAVAVGEPLARREHRRVARRGREVLLGRGQLVDRDRHHVVGDRHRPRPRRGSRRCPSGGTSRCSTVTPSSINGRSAPSTDRAVVDRSSDAILDQAHDGEGGQALHAARDREPVSTVLAIAWARSASPYAFASSEPSAASTRTVPENPVAPAMASTASSRGAIPEM